MYLQPGWGGYPYITSSKSGLHGVKPNKYNRFESLLIRCCPLSAVTSCQVSTQNQRRAKSPGRSHFFYDACYSQSETNSVAKRNENQSGKRFITPGYEKPTWYIKCHCSFTKSSSLNLNITEAMGIFRPRAFGKTGRMGRGKERTARTRPSEASERGCVGGKEREYKSAICFIL